MKNNYLEIKNVDFIIGGKTKVKDVSFSIENEGETLCILGPSGIGKTTILRTIAGLEKVKKGSIKLNGLKISVIGSSLIISKEINITTNKSEFLKNGMWIFIKVFCFE